LFTDRGTAVATSHVAALFALDIAVPAGQVATANATATADLFIFTALLFFWWLLLVLFFFDVAAGWFFVFAACLCAPLVAYDVRFQCQCQTRSRSNVGSKHAGKCCRQSR